MDRASEHADGSRLGAADRYIVLVDDQADPAEVARWAGVEPVETVSDTLRGFVAELPMATVTDLLGHPRVRFIEPAATEYAVVHDFATGAARATLMDLGVDLASRFGPAVYRAPLLPGSPVGGVYIVVLNDRADPSAVASSVGVAPVHTYQHAIQGFSAALPSSALSGLLSNPAVRFVEPDREVWAAAQVTPTGVARSGAADAAQYPPNLASINVAVIDTGVDADHPDLRTSIGKQCTSGANRQGDDNNGHGTHVAGTIGALDNNSQVVGVAPGVTLYGVKVLAANGSGTWSQVICGIDWVTGTRTDTNPSNDIHVANMSLSGAGSDGTCGSSSLHQAICNSVATGVVYTVAAGNEGVNAAGSVPATFAEVITVSALADFDGAPGGLNDQTIQFSSCTERDDDSFACFSNYGADVDIMAPGVQILSTTMGGGTGYSSGTSMASPHVAGAAARFIAENGAPTNAAGVAAVRQALIDAGDPAPCSTNPNNGSCNDDPDSIQEPLLNVSASGCESDGDCDDGNACNGGETCDLASGSCGSGTPVDCNDGNACTADSCDPVNGSCSHNAITCNDGNACTSDSCNPVSGCSYTPVADNNSCSGGICCGGSCTTATCSLNADCNDGMSCSVDTCSAGGTCGASCEYDDSACGGGPVCGNGVCEGGGEDCTTCSGDCTCRGRDCSRGCCGDGVCNGSEKANNCPVDCN